MDKEKINFWVNHLANAGVILGIVLLLIELNQNNELVRAQIHQSRTDSFTSVMFGIGDSEHLAVLDAKMNGMENVNNLANLTQVERARLAYFHRAVIADYENAFYQYQAGYLDNDYWEGRIAPYIKVFYPMWNELGILGANSQQFLSMVHEIIAE